MAIVANLPCPKCQENGRDSTGNHLLVFSDGGKFCGKGDYHKDGQPYYETGDGQDAVINADITGKIRYSAIQFKELINEGKIDSEYTRQLALAGMSEKERYEVLNEDELAVLHNKWKEELKHFEHLKIKNLVTRGIRGPIAKLYNVRVGVDEKGKTARHYYPRYEHSALVGAKCRTLPKDFVGGNLGRVWGDCDMFGMHTLADVSDSGRRRDVLLVVGGELDALAAQQMLLDSQKGTSYEGTFFHVWSPNKGENLQDIIHNLDHIKRFRKVIWAFDADEVGNDLNEKAYRLLSDKSVVLKYPEGMKDANQCLLEGRGKDFASAWWDADKPDSTELCTVEDLYEEALEEVEEGLSFPWNDLTNLTLGIRLHNMYTIGGGSGVGKTEVAKEVIFHLMEHHKEKVGVIFMEEKASYTLRVLAGKLINKKIHLPVTKVGHPNYDESRDYRKADVVRALDMIQSYGLLTIADCKGDTHINNIMDKIKQLRAKGVKYIFIDNLTTISFDHENDVKGIDEAMKSFGTYMQEEPVSLFLLSHLTRPHQSRKPHEEGGEIQQRDFRGSGSIAFWSTFMIGVERNTQAQDVSERCTTYLRCVKDRLTGMATGQLVALTGNQKTGRLQQGKSYSRQTESTEDWSGEY